MPPVARRMRRRRRLQIEALSTDENYRSNGSTCEQSIGRRLFRLGTTRTTTSPVEERKAAFEGVESESERESAANRHWPIVLDLRNSHRRALSSQEERLKKKKSCPEFESIRPLCRFRLASAQPANYPPPPPLVTATGSLRALAGGLLLIGPHQQRQQQQQPFCSTSRQLSLSLFAVSATPSSPGKPACAGEARGGE